MRLPQKKKPGDPVLASDWNLLLEAIAARTPRPGTGLELIASSGGFAYSRQSPVSAAHAGLPPFSVIGIEKNGGSYLVTVKEGWVIERKPKSADAPAVRFHIPKAGGQALDTVPRPQIGMSIGDTLWCRFSTDMMGEISGEPEVFASSGDQDGNHHYPEDEEGSGSEGNYRVKLLRLDSDNGTPTVKPYQQSDIEHWAQLWSGENLGGGARIYKEHKENENSYKFRTLRRRESQHQIDVVEEEDLIRVQGNGKDGSLALGNTTSSSQSLLEWKDGLVTSQGQKSVAVKEYMVCEYGTAKPVKFLIVE